MTVAHERRLPGEAIWRASIAAIHEAFVSSDVNPLTSVQIDAIER
jgi:hypothetical protein